MATRDSPDFKLPAEKIYSNVYPQPSPERMQMEFLRIMDKLIEDGLVKVERDEISVNSVQPGVGVLYTRKEIRSEVYGVTFQGIVFSQNGGYRRAHLKENLMVAIKVIEATALVIAAVGTMYYARMSYLESKAADDRLLKESVGPQAIERPESQRSKKESLQSGHPN